MRRSFFVLGAAAVLSAIACGSSTSTPPADLGGSDGGALRDSGLLPGVDSGGGADSGGSNDGSSGGDGAADSGAGDADAEAGPAPHSSCPPQKTWPTVAPVVSIASAGFDHFGAVSPDELTAAWMNASGALLVADRSTPTDVFGAPQTINTSGVQLATGRVALHYDGNAIVAALADGSSFAKFERAARGSAWTQSTTSEFADLAALLVESGGAFSDPVLANDGNSLFYMMQTGGNVPTLHESKWDPVTRHWAPPSAINNPELLSVDATHRRRPTGTSVDSRTLFYFDEVSGTEHAAWRDTPKSPFNFFRDLGSLAEATPNAKCSRLYFENVDTDAGAIGLWTAQ